MAGHELPQLRRLRDVLRVEGICLGADDRQKLASLGYVSGGATPVIRKDAPRAIDMVGLLPDELQTWIGFAAGVSTNAKAPELALKLVKALAAPSAEPFMRQVGLQPFVE